MSFVHHTNILIGFEDPEKYLKDFFIQELNFNIYKNPDFLLLRQEVFGIEDARQFEKWVIGKPIASNHKVALLIFGSITSEAQNALLKVTEEPKGETYLFLSIESLANILPTLISRSVILSRELKEEKNSDFSEKFFKSSINDRLKTTYSLLKSEDKSKILNFISSLEMLVHKKTSYMKNRDKILKAKKYITARGASQRMIMEWLSCVL